MEEGERGYFVRRLQELAAQLKGQLEQLDKGLGQSAREALQELASYDNHPGDLGSEVFERSKDLALRDQLQRRLQAVRQALARVEAGTYGYCQRCGQPVEKGRLEALPETAWCLACRQVVEAARGHRRRPVEEEVIVPPFGGLYGQGARPGEEAAYDGEDAWQEVARYGTSETVADVPGSREYPRVYSDWDEERGAVEAIDALPYYRDDESGMLYTDYTRADDEGRPRRR